MTIKLYENDSYIKEFSATVLSCEAREDGYDVVLDKTAFFAEGGGQDADTGVLGDANVKHVKLDGEDVVHKTDAPLTVGSTVKGVIDWQLRFSRMQNHCAEHILSGIINSKYGYNNVGFHMNDSLVTFDVDGSLTAEDIKLIEQEANNAIYKNLPISASYPTSSEIKTLNYRSKLDMDEGVRLITVEGYDCCACCAPHPARTGEIGIIKILNFFSNKGGTRIEMVAGMLAYQDYAYLHNMGRSIMALLSASRNQIYDAVLKEHEDLISAKATNRGLNQKLIFNSLDTKKINASLCGFSKEATFDELRYCSELLNETDIEYCVLFADMGENGYNYLVSSGSKDVGVIVKEINTAFNGKGGGKPNCAQGRITAKSKEEIVDLLNKFL